MTQEAKTLAGIAIGTILLLGGAVFFLSNQSAPKSDIAETVIEESKLITSESAKRGPEQAKVTIVEFGDYECPACGAVHPETEKLYEEYKDRVKFVFRHYPLPQHKNAFNASRAAEASGAQGKYWEMHDKLYDFQLEWTESENPKEFFVKYAEGLGLNRDLFLADLDSNKFDAEINGDYAQGTSIGVQGTPTFYINGKKLEGGFLPEKVKALIDSELNK